MPLEQGHPHESFSLLIRQDLNVLVSLDVVELDAEEGWVDEDRIGFIEFEGHLLQLFGLTFDFTFEVNPPLEISRVQLEHEMLRAIGIILNFLSTSN